jgi:NitT/TauT family transport system permease protein
MKTINAGPRLPTVADRAWAHRAGAGRLAVACLVVFAYLAALEVTCRMWGKMKIVAPPPSEILVELVGRQFVSKDYWDAVWATFCKVSIAIAMAVLIGYPLGFLAGLREWSRAAFAWPMNAARAIPTVILAPVFMLLFAGGDAQIVAMAIFPTLGTIFAGVAQALGTNQRSRSNICRALGMRWTDQVRHCLFWETLGRTLVLVVAALPMTVALVVALEYFEMTERGLGAFVKRAYSGREKNYLPTMYSGIVTVAVLGIMATFVPSYFVRRILHDRSDR